MNEFSTLRTRKRSMVLLLALMLVVVLLIAQFSWVAASTTAAAFTCTGLGYGSTVQSVQQDAPCSHYLGLLELYKAGRLVYHAPGR